MVNGDYSSLASFELASNIGCEERRIQRNKIEKLFQLKEKHESIQVINILTIRIAPKGKPSLIFE
jgi:hypothetical protein